MSKKNQYKKGMKEEQDSSNNMEGARHCPEENCSR